MSGYCSTVDEEAQATLRAKIHLQCPRCLFSHTLVASSEMPYVEGGGLFGPPVGRRRFAHDGLECFQQARRALRIIIH